MSTFLVGVARRTCAPPRGSPVEDSRIPEITAWAGAGWTMAAIGAVGMGGFPGAAAWTIFCIANPPAPVRKTMTSTVVRIIFALVAVIMMSAPLARAVPVVPQV